MPEYVADPCKRCGKTLRYDYNGYCMDCADELGLSEIYTGLNEEDKAKMRDIVMDIDTDMAQEDKDRLMQRLAMTLTQKVGTKVMGTYFDRVKLTPNRQWASEFRVSYHQDPMAKENDKVTVDEATALILNAKEFNIRDEDKVKDLLIYSQNKSLRMNLPLLCSTTSALNPCLRSHRHEREAVVVMIAPRSQDSR